MRICLPLLACTLVLTPVLADTQKAVAAHPAASTKRDDLLKLMNLLGTGTSNSEAARSRIAAARKEPKLASLPDAYWNDLEKAASPEAFDRILYPVFDKAYSHDEIKQLIKLISMPEFKTWSQKNPMEKVAREGFPLFSKFMDEEAKKAKAKHVPQASKPKP